jgi:hypothetical protein
MNIERDILHMDKRVLAVLRAVAEGWQEYDEVEDTFAFKCHFCGRLMGEHKPRCVVETAQKILSQLEQP